jgi:hypothetical protein
MRGLINSMFFHLVIIAVKKDGAGRHLQREFLSPLEALVDQLWVIPPSHFTPQKVRDLVDGFSDNGMIITS